MTENSEKIALVLQGGGALGAYQAGAYEALSAEDIVPDWLSGISIGAINAAIIAGNPANRRVEQLRNFWQGISADMAGAQLLPGDAGRSAFNEASSWLATVMGIKGFFAPRLLPPMFQAPGTPEALSYYDTTPLRKTLEELIDFNLLNEKGPRLTIGAVNVRTGNFICFDSNQQKIGVENIMASAALPPGFPPVVINGEAYWDGGLVSNTPLQYVLDNNSSAINLRILQVDLFNAAGPMPKTIFEVAEREKEIRYSSRTRLNTSAARELFKLRNAAKRLAKRLPESLGDDPDLKTLTADAPDAGISIYHLIHRPTAYDTQSKDYEFSRLSMNEHWEAGKIDALKTLHHPAWKSRAAHQEGMMVFDLANPKTSDAKI